jgi:hypothetical protein
VKVLSTTTKETYGVALETATIELQNNEVRFIVGANRRIAAIYGQLHGDPLSTREREMLIIEASDLSNKLNVLLSPRLEEVLITISNDFLKNFDPFTTEEVIEVKAYKKSKEDYAMNA